MDSTDSFQVLICSKASPKSKVANLQAGLKWLPLPGIDTLCGPLPYCLKDNVCDLAKMSYKTPQLPFGALSC